MPSKSKAQRNLMAAAAHNPSFAKKVGIPVSVAQDFNKADKGKKFGGGGMAKSDMKEDSKMDMAQDKAMIKKAFKQHDAQEHKGSKGTKLSLKKGGMCGGGMSKSKKYARGGGIEVRGKTKGRII
jgi:phage tail sheath gpL-like